MRQQLAFAGLQLRSKEALMRPYASANLSTRGQNLCSSWPAMPVVAHSALILLRVYPTLLVSVCGRHRIKAHKPQLASSAYDLPAPCMHTTVLSSVPDSDAIMQLRLEGLPHDGHPSRLHSLWRRDLHRLNQRIVDVRVKAGGGNAKCAATAVAAF
eukprot:5442161-Prymnesium_polylepis.1